MVGSLSPDFFYAVGLGSASHQFFPGSFVLCLPAGLVVMALLWQLRQPIVKRLPESFLRRALLPVSEQKCRFGVNVPVSVLIGSWTHIWLDDLCHTDGWMVEHFRMLRVVIVRSSGSWIRGYDILYGLFTLGGVTWLAMAYLAWIQKPGAFPGKTRSATRWILSGGMGAVILAVAVFSRGAHQRLATPLAVLVTGLLIVAFLCVVEVWLLSKSKPGAALRNAGRKERL